ncbi:MAG TPA: histidine kinase dimerization/phosphoacceptor domain -containing protein [Beijerinckiaceae bacterium]|jgi:two-component sensor histidine kinase
MRILFVDDDPDTRALAIRALVQEFPEAVTPEASDLASLDAALREGAPAILISDYDLRWTDGFKVFDRVKAAAPECCAVMFTGTGNEELAVRAMKHGFDDYVVKGTTQLRRLATSARVSVERAGERKRLSENRDLILRELYHRLHNNLQIVISLLRLTEKALATEEDRQQLADLGRRIQALSALQEVFYRSEDLRRVDFGAFLDGLAENLVGIAGGRVVLDRRLESTTIPVDVAVPLGLIANELITNALKHGFPNGRAGRLSVGLEAGDGRLVLTVADDGVGFERGMTAAGPGGLGMRLVQRLVAQVDGELRFERAEVGTRCLISLPL